jgi:hypothetical protein
MDPTSDALIAALHASPEDTLITSQNVRARRSVAIHFATFPGGEYEALGSLEVWW